MRETIIYLFLGIMVLLVAESIYFLVRYLGERQRVQLKRRLNSIAKPGSTSLIKERRVAKNQTLDRILRNLPLTERLEKLLIQTDLTWTVAMLMGFGLLLGAGFSTILFFAFRPTPIVAVLGIPLGFIFPPIYALSARAKRSKKISSQIPDALDMMARSLQAGHGISAGFKLVATEMPAPIAVEFGRCFEEHNLGVEFRNAVINMTQRVPGNLDLKLLAVSIVIQHETGGNLVEILEQISMTIRERFKFFGRLRALTAEGKASAVVLGSLPFFFSLTIAVMNPRYMAPLWSEPMGQAILAGGIVFWILGIFWIRSLSRVDF